MLVSNTCWNLTDWPDGSHNFEVTQSSLKKIHVEITAHQVSTPNTSLLGLMVLEIQLAELNYQWQNPRLVTYNK